MARRAVPLHLLVYVQLICYVYHAVLVNKDEYKIGLHLPTL